MSQPAHKKPDDAMLIFEDDRSTTGRRTTKPWRILIVDDDSDVHESTRFALRDTVILGRPVELLHAYSAAEALKVVAESGDIAVALVDVVMETPDAGLRLIHDLRERGYTEMRLILRTGQPGYAPELAVMATYEIDDYRTKAELTRTRIVTVLTAAIRAYEQIRAISRSRAGLEMIVESTTELFQRTNLELLSCGVLTQIASLLGIEANGFVCQNPIGGEDPEKSTIISAMGHFAGAIGAPLGEIGEPELVACLKKGRELPGPVVENGYMALHFGYDITRDLSALIEADCEIAPEDIALLKVFSTNIAISFENLALIERLDRLAHVDPVLGIPNLNAFGRILGKHLGTGVHRGHMALMTVESFQSIVAAYGHTTANQFLRQVHDRLVAAATGRLTVARVGDATFALLGESAVLDEHVVPAAFAEPYHIDDIEISAIATTVIVDLADPELDLSAVMRTGSSALQHVRRTARGKSVIYDAHKRAEVERRITLQIALKRAIEQGEGLAVHLQPKVNIATGDVIGAEALLRWNLEGQAVSPGEFIPIAESAGLTQPLTEFVVDTLGRWAHGRRGAAPLAVAVNLSMADLNSPGFARPFLERVLEAGLSPKTLQFEVTEGIAMHQASGALAQVQLLKDAGFRIALDDFGTGYSSLGNFSQLPIDILKIDRAFISRLDVHTARTSLAAIVVAMAHAMDVECVAEGIETHEQKQALQFLGCTVGQGFLFGRPEPIETFEESFLNKGKAG